MQKIVPNLWFNSEAVEAATFYVSLFDHSQINWSTIIKDTPSGDSEQLSFTLAGLDFFAISAGEKFSFTPAISLSVYCETQEEVESLWRKLIVGGSALMPLDTYPFSKRYGWLQDRYGLSWQITYTEERVSQKIVPSLMFVGNQYGKAEKAIHQYLSIFKKSSIQDLIYEEEKEPAHTIQFAKFDLEGLTLITTENGINHNFSFNESISFMVYCENQEEIDYYWDKLSAVPEAEECGWLKDSFDVSWQIIPYSMNQMMLSEDEAEKARVIQALLKMKKINLAEIQYAYEGH